MENERDEVRKTLTVLCKWVQDRCDKQKATSSEDMKILPEVINAIARLYETLI